MFPSLIIYHYIMFFQSGAIMGILGFVCTQYPDVQLSIIFLPMFTFTAGAVCIDFSHTVFNNDT